MTEHAALAREIYIRAAAQRLSGPPWARPPAEFVTLAAQCHEAARAFLAPPTPPAQPPQEEVTP